MVRCACKVASAENSPVMPGLIAPRSVQLDPHKGRGTPVAHPPDEPNRAIPMLSVQAPIPIPPATRFPVHLASDALSPSTGVNARSGLSAHLSGSVVSPLHPNERSARGVGLSAHLSGSVVSPPFTLTNEARGRWWYLGRPPPYESNSLLRGRPRTPARSRSIRHRSSMHSNCRHFPSGAGESCEGSGEQTWRDDGGGRRVSAYGTSAASRQADHSNSASLRW
eukprot:COSAG02_NODE_1643_length_11528_cov_19.259865_2_plen_223_part_00